MHTFRRRVGYRLEGVFSPSSAVSLWEMPKLVSALVYVRMFVCSYVCMFVCMSVSVSVSVSVPVSVSVSVCLLRIVREGTVKPCA